MNKIRKRGIIAYSLMALLVLLTGFILFRIHLSNLQSKTLQTNQVKLDAVAEMMNHMESTRESAKASFYAHMEKHLRFMEQDLSGYVTEDGYTGPRLFSDSAVVELRGDQPVWPEGVPEAVSELSAEEIRREGQIQAGGTYYWILRIAEDLYYVNWTAENEILTDQYIYLKDEDFLNAAGQSFDGNLLMASLEGEELPLIFRSETFPAIQNAAELGFTLEIIAEQREIVRLSGADYLCVYQKLADGNTELIYVEPYRTLTWRSLIYVCMAELSAMIIFATIIAYILSVYHYVANNELTDKQKEKYRPRNLRRVVIMAGITGALIVFVSTAILNTLDTLHEGSVIAAKSTNALFEQIRKSVTDREAYEISAEDAWYVYHGQHIVSRIERNAEAGSEENLKAYCDLFGIDYIMLFDAEGQEIACSEDYTGLAINTDPGADSAELGRLLLGAPSVTVDTAKDPVTGQNRHYIGVSVPVTRGGKKAHGALVMAVAPREQESRTTLSGLLKQLNPDDITIFYADSESREILYSNNDSLLHQTITDIGLREKSLEDGYTDFAVIKGVPNYVTTVRKTTLSFFYAIPNSRFLADVMRFSLSAVCSYLVFLVIILMVCLKGYIDEGDHYINAIGNRTQKIRNAKKKSTAPDHEKNERYMDGSELLISKKLSDYRLENRTPESLAASIIKLDALLLILIMVVLYLFRYGTTINNNTLVYYILHGDWVRGINLFSFCGIMMILGIGIMVIDVSNIVLSLITGFTDRPGETVCRLLYSLIRYLTILVIVYYVFDFVGLPLSTYIASLSMVSLAISIGSQKMVADILAGLLIIFERQCQVGDYVQIDGQDGMVLEIGICSTKLITETNGIQYIKNSDIKSIFNNTKKFVYCSTEITIITTKTLEQVEEILNRELPAMKEKLKMIQGGPYYWGVEKMNGGGKADSSRTMTLSFGCKCGELDRYEAKSALQRELYLLCEREGFETFENYMRLL